MNAGIKERLSALALLAALCGVLPLAAWATTRLFYSEAILEGPFLLMSPAAAVMIATILFSRHWGRPVNLSVNHAEIEEEIGELGKSMGLQPMRVYPQPAEDRSHSWPIEVRSEGILLFLDSWNEWEPRSRHFMAAWLLAHRGAPESVVKLRVAGVGLFLFATAILASLNLWTILATQALGVSMIFVLATSHAKRQAIESDARALEATRDYAAARSFIDWQSKGYRWLGKPFLERRREAVVRKAIDLGLKFEEA